MAKLTNPDDIKKQKALMREIETKKISAELAVANGKTALAELTVKLAAAQTAVGTADSKFKTVQKKWNDTLLAEKDAKRSKVKQAYEEGESMVTELTEKLAMYNKAGNAAAVTKVTEELARVRKAFEKADFEMQAINASEAKEQEEKYRKEKMAARMKVEAQRKRERDAADADTKKVSDQMADYNKRIQYYLDLNKKITDETEKDKNYAAISGLRDKYFAAKKSLTDRQTKADELKERQAK